MELLDKTMQSEVYRWMLQMIDKMGFSSIVYYGSFFERIEIFVYNTSPKMYITISALLRHIKVILSKTIQLYR